MSNSVIATIWSLKVFFYSKQINLSKKAAKNHFDNFEDQNAEIYDGIRHGSHALNESTVSTAFETCRDSFPTNRIYFVIHHFS